MDGLVCVGIALGLEAVLPKVRRSPPADESKHELPDSQAYGTAAPKLAKPDNTTA
jgi:hypothetical protein